MVDNVKNFCVAGAAGACQVSRPQDSAGAAAQPGPGPLKSARAAAPPEPGPVFWPGRGAPPGQTPGPGKHCINVCMKYKSS